MSCRLLLLLVKMGSTYDSVMNLEMYSYLFTVLCISFSEILLQKLHFCLVGVLVYKEEIDKRIDGAY